ncbi:hypothetical protein D9M71_398530 [compost metagenome]
MLLALEALPGIDIVTLQVAHRCRQPRNAHGHEVVVVTHLPGALIGKRELIGRHFVAQRRNIRKYTGKGIFTINTLVADAERMPAALGRQQ